MKTLLFHINSLLTGGIEKILLEILKGLDPKKYRIKLSVTYHMAERELLRNEVPDYVEVHYLLEHPFLTTPHKKKKAGNTNFIEKALSELILPPIQKTVKIKILKRLLKDVDVVIDFDTTLSPLHELFATKKSIAYRHFRFDNVKKKEIRRSHKLIKRLSHYDYVVMLCDEMKDEAERFYPSISPNLVRIYNALNVEKIKNLAYEPVELPDDFITNGYLISVGRLHETQKDFTTLLKAYALAIKKKDIKERLIIVGEGSSKPLLELLARQLMISERVLFTGRQENPYKWMKAAAIFLFSSRYEGLPTVLIEAHVMGLPIIATATPTGVNELLMHGEAGCLVPVGDEEAMANAIVELLGNEALQERYRKNAQELLPQFEINHMVPQLEKLF